MGYIIREMTRAGGKSARFFRFFFILVNVFHKKTMRNCEENVGI